MKINCIIIDDEHPAIRQMEKYVQAVPFLKLLGSFDNAIEPIQFLKSHEIDLVFLDIEMEDFTGLQFIRSLKTKPATVLTTAYDQYAIEAFNLNVSDYLLKPISFERFIQSVDKIYDQFARKHFGNDASVSVRNYIFVKTEYKLQRIDFKDIMFIEGKGEYLKIHCSGERIMTLMSFRDLEKSLPSGQFVRVHKSFIVHLEKIDKIERQRIFIGKESIPISNTYRDAFLLQIQK